MTRTQAERVASALTHLLIGNSFSHDITAWTQQDDEIVLTLMSMLEDSWRTGYALGIRHGAAFAHGFEQETLQ